MRFSGQALEIPSMSLVEMLQHTANQHPQQPATWFMEHTLTYQELYQLSLRTMAELRARGIQRGDRVGVMLPNCPEYVIAYFAITGLGAIVVQINPMSTVSELNYLLTDSGARALLTYESFLNTVADVRRAVPLDLVIGVRFTSKVNTTSQAETGRSKSDRSETDRSETGQAESSQAASRQSISVKQGGSDESQPDVWLDTWFNEGTLAEPPSVETDTVAVLQYTGGTTGRPKGAMLTHRNLVANAVQSSTMVPTGITIEDKMVCALPFFHVYAMTVCMNLSVLTGMTMYIVPRFDAKVILALFKNHRPTLFPGVPTMYVALSQFVKAGEDTLSSLRVCNSGGAPLPEQVMVHFEQLTGAVVLEGYGLSEASPVTHTNPSADERRSGSIGLPVANTEACVVDVEDGFTELEANQAGELLIRGPQVMLGYWNRPEETERTLVDGWLHTGDIAKIDEDGYAYIVDRKKDLIIASGFNVYPREVEEALYKHPAVLEAAVVGVEDDYRGETVKAFVVVKPNEQLTEEDVLAWCRKQLSAYKVPRAVEFRDELPKSAVGKVLRRDLRSVK